MRAVTLDTTSGTTRGLVVVAKHLDERFDPVAFGTTALIMESS